MSSSKKRNRYREKLDGAPKKPQVNKWCKTCLSPHCHCWVDTREHFYPTTEQLQAWYG